MSAAWEFMLYIQRRLKAIPFNAEGADPCGPIKSDAIVIQKQLGKAGEERLPHLLTPGLVVTPPKTISSPAEAGTNARDDIYYPFLVQLVDTDGSERLQNLQSYLAWLERIRKAFHCHSIIEIPVEVGCANSYAATTDVVDEKRWVKEGKFVAGVVVLVVSRESRGIEL